MTLLCGSANAVWSSVRSMDLSATYDDPRKWPITVIPKVPVEEFADGLLWTRSSMVGGVSPITYPGPRFQDFPKEPDGGGQSQYRFVGFTLDENGNPLGSCIVQGFLTSAYAPAGLAADAFVGQMTSDPGGYYEFWTPYVGQQHYLVCYKGGSPDATGSSVNTLVPSAP